MPRALTESPIELLAKADEMRKKAEQSFGEYALQAGMYLIQAKRRIPHGQWQEHVEKYSGFSLRSAETYMRARRRYDSMPAAEQRSVLEQPFTRSLLVLTQAPKPSSVIRLPPSSNGHVVEERIPEIEQQSTDERLAATRETTALVDAAIEYHEPTPLDDILDGPARTYEDEPSQAEISAEQLETFKAMEQEVARLERQNRELTRELADARATGQKALRGWDYVEQLVQYLRADEPQRTPESLAKRAMSQSGGPEIISYLEMFFSSARQHVAQVA